jgi:hypothetical protein
MIWIRKKNDKQNTTTKRTKMKYTKTNWKRDITWHRSKLIKLTITMMHKCITIGVSKTKLPSMLSEASLDALAFYDK